MIGEVHLTDCLEGLSGLPDASIDMLFADLPYGVTQNTWDKPVLIEPFWEQIKRVCRPEAALVFTAQQPFTSSLVVSNPKWFRFSMVWEKNNVRGFLNAKRQPLRSHEDLLIFYRRQPLYRPQMTDGHEPVHAYTKTKGDGSNYGRTRTSSAAVPASDTRPPYFGSRLSIQPTLNASTPRRSRSVYRPGSSRPIPTPATLS